MFYTRFLPKHFDFIARYHADENLRLIKASFPEVIEACVDAAMHEFDPSLQHYVDAAGHEFDPSLQQTLLRAASYGQAFCR
ncbi:unnamed protein product [Lactuca virosa]|uniref:Vps16 N-terminal domain-containing protein n=1 Tax=Lactuca virosa TaxID=75947 RepID=A0AAU9P033_9ASTR|nr:unnamed protein product [Lactuca virosa]